jgi:hypothetical protein
LLKIKIKTKRKPLPLTQPAIHLTKPMVSPFSPLIAGHFLISIHILRGKKGKEGEKLSPFCWPKFPWRKNLHSCSSSSFPPPRKG